MGVVVLLGAALFVSGAPATSAWVQVTYPNGNECFTPGDMVTITWDGSGYDHVAIGYRLDVDSAPSPYALDPGAWNVAHPVPGSSYAWATPSTISEGVAYKVWIEGHDAVHNTVASADSSDTPFGFAKNCGIGTTTDITPPVVTFLSPLDGSEVSGTVTLKVDASDDVGVQWVDFYVGSTYLGTVMTSPYTMTWDTTLFSDGLHNLDAVAFDTSSQSAQASIYVTVNNGTFTEPPSPGDDTTPPIISGVGAINISGYEATITFDTDDPSFVALDYGTTVNYDTFTPFSGFAQTSHSIDIGGLQPSTLYHYRVFAQNTSGFFTESGDFTFRTLESTSKPPPTSAGAVLTGVVLGPDGKPLGGAFVEVHTEDYLVSFYGAPTAADGSYGIFDIVPGTYLVDVYPPELTAGFISPSPVTMTFAAGDSLIKNLQFIRASKTLEGRVVDVNNVPITDAMVWAYSETSSFGASVDVNSLGYYSLSLKGGTWNVGVEPQNPASSRWTYSKPPVRVTFADDSTSETKTLDFIVTKTDAFIKGRVLLPDGSPPDPQKVFLGLRTTLGDEVHVQISSDGFFNAAVPAGSYEIMIWVDDPAISAPPLAPFSVESGTTYDLGTITLTRVSDHIKGKVTDTAGTPVRNVRITAWIPSGAGFAQATTNLSGEYDLLVTPGTWEVWVEVDPTLNYSYTGEPRRVTVVSGVPSTGVDFVLTSADATISGQVVDPSGVLLEDFYGFAFAFDATGFEHTSAGGGPVDRGRFVFKVPAGSYKVGVDVPPGAKYSPGLPQAVTVATGQTATITIKLRSNDAKIVGTLRDVNGSAITGVFAEIFAGSEQGIWQRGDLDTSTGTYSINVSSGTWYLGVHVDPASGYISREGDIPLTVTSGQTLTRDLVLTKAASTLNVSVKDPDGKPLPNVWVSVDKVSFSTFETDQPEDFSDIHVNGDSTDSQGKVSLKLPAGTFFVHAFMPPDKGFINPKEEKVVMIEGGSQDITLNFRRATLSISGRVLLDGVGVEAFVWAWSDGAGYTETRSSVSGSFTLAVSGNDTWHFGADKRLASGEFYYSRDLSVIVGDTSVSGQDIVLVKSLVTVPDSSSETYDVTDHQTISLDDGTKVSIPANSLGTSGNFTVTVTPDAEVPNQGTSNVVGVGYDIVAHDESGQTITQLNSEITINLPYTDAALAEAGVTADDLSAAFWDETVSTWRTLDNSVNDKTNKVVTATVDHLTRFALIAPAAAAGTPTETPSEEGPIVEQVTSAEDLNEGNVIRGPDGIKVYIINEHGYKRHIFNPTVFNMYGHIGWESIKEVSQTTLDLYVTSDLYRADVDPKVYSLEEVDEAAGVAIKRWLDMTPEKFLELGYKWQQVFIVNETERDYYQTGDPITG